MKNYQKELTLIQKTLRSNPRGLTITDISKKININRNSVAKYMDVLLISGRVEMRRVGPAKVFFLSQRVPVSALLNFSSDYILTLDNDLKAIQVNNNLLNFMKTKREAVLGLSIEDFPHQVFKDQEILRRIKEALNGKDSSIETKCQAAKVESHFDMKMIPTTFDDGSEGVTLILHDITERKRAEEERDKLLHDFSERVKELACLYGMSKLVEKPEISLEGILEGTVGMLPPASQYPDIACARIVFENQEFKTRNFKETRWKQQSDIKVYGRRVGVVEVYYLEEKTEFDECPFLEEERDLIEAVAERLGRIAERKKAEEALEPGIIHEN